MLILGAKGHAKEVFDLLDPSECNNLCFFDNVSEPRPVELFGYPVLNSLEALKQHFQNQANFIVGIGDCILRYKLQQLAEAHGGKATSLVAKSAHLSNSALLGEGVSLMAFSLVSAHVSLGKGVLINANAAIHHDCQLGNFVEIGPGAKLLGQVNVGDFTFIGANATILPKLSIGSNVVIAAGAMVTQDVPDNCMVAGNPAQLKKQRTPLVL
ncbi:MAG: acetyltransferase [Flavobacterium sp.]|nr:acetyltransferase [Flavobacterium sp.]